MKDAQCSVEFPLLAIRFSVRVSVTIRIKFGGGGFELALELKLGVVLDWGLFRRQHPPRLRFRRVKLLRQHNQSQRTTLEVCGPSCLSMLDYGSY